MRDGPIPRFLATLYGSASGVHAAAWDHGWLKAKEANVPVLSIGNLAVGGTGKTPAVIRIAAEFARRGRRVAVLSRGYGRKSADRIVVQGADPGVGVEAAGDEPLEIAAALGTIPVIVSADRVGSARLAEAPPIAADLLILDDGFQHRPLARTVDLVLLDAAQPFGNGRLLPAGPLREKPEALGRAGMILLTRSDAAPDPEASRREILHVAPRAWIGLADHRVMGLEPAVGDHPPLDPERPVTVTAGIADPAGVARSVASLGHLVRAIVPWPDHHRYGAVDLARVLDAAGSSPIVTTAKDWVRWREAPGIDPARWWIAGIRFEPREPEEFFAELERRLFGE